MIDTVCYLEVVPWISWVVFIIYLTCSTIIFLLQLLPQIFVNILHDLPRICWSLKENVDEEKLVEDGKCKAESPECRVRPQEGSIRHDCHAQGDPEEERCQESSLTIVSGVLYWSLYQTWAGVNILYFSEQIFLAAIIQKFFIKCPKNC